MGIKLGSFLRKAREDRGLSQKDLADLLDLKSAQSISNIERGASPLPRALVPSVSLLLKVEREELVDILIEEVRLKYLAIPDKKAALSKKMAKKLKLSRAR